MQHEILEEFQSGCEGNPTLAPGWRDLVAKALALYPDEVGRGIELQSGSELSDADQADLAAKRQKFDAAKSALIQACADQHVPVPELDPVDICGFIRKAIA